MRTIKSRIAPTGTPACLFLALGLIAAVTPPAAAQAPVPAGVAAAVTGRVEVSGPPRAGTLPVASGMEMFLDDRIVTGRDSRLQVLLRDETVFTVGPGSDLVIDRFVYDPDTGTGEVAARVATGFLRYVSGQVGAANPEAVRIATPAATIGIRGTALMVGQMPDAPDTFFCAVLGPGRDNNALARRGACEIANEHGSVSIRQEGFAAFVRPGEAPGPAVRVDADMLSALQVALRPGPDAAAAGRGGTAAVAAEAAAISRPVLTISGQRIAELREAAFNQGTLLVNRFDLLTGNLDTDTIDPITPSPTLDVPAFAQLTHNGAFDLDLHATGPLAGGSGRYHVFFANPVGPAGSSGLPAVELDAVQSSLPNSEVLSINALNGGGVTRISVFNFSDQSYGSTTLAEQSGAVVSLLRDGLLERGPGGSVVVKGTLVDQVTPPAGGRGNTFIAYEILPDGTIDAVRGFADYPNAGAVK